MEYCRAKGARYFALNCCSVGEGDGNYESAVESKDIVTI